MQYIFSYKGRTIECLIETNNVHIKNSYLIRQPSDMKEILNIIRKWAAEKGFSYKRTVSSWVTEWKAHNILYSRCLERQRSGSVDLNENERKVILLSYKVLAKFYRP